MTIKQIPAALAMLAAMVMLPSCGDDKVDDPVPTTPIESETPAEEFTLVIPDKAGASIKGVVYCGTTPLAGVAVSDGDKVVTTDVNGRYYINSTKRHPNVFVSIPSGYFPKTDGVWPQFYGLLTKSATTVEQVNFELIEKPATDYVVIGLADLHIANVRNTIGQFNTNYLPDLNATIREYKAAGKDVYCITLGDESHDLYWYGYQNDPGDPITIADTKPYLGRIEATAIFNSMGNHDNDPYVADDFLAEHLFRSTYGPTHYSFNIAGTHYVVLDDIVYINNGGAQGKRGDRSISKRVTDEQLAWLRNDLSTVKKSTPVVVCMHAMFFNKEKLFNGSQIPKIRYDLENHADLAACLAGYNVVILSGHAHLNSSNRVDNIIEYNIGGANGDLWTTGQAHMAGNHMCGDGSVGGYFVMEKTGITYQAYYKSIGFDRNYQFRTYDLNRSHITAVKYCPNSTDAAIAAANARVDPSTGPLPLDGYDEERSDNLVRINVFGFNEKWSIKVTENGKALTTTRINSYDPLHFISRTCKDLQNGVAASSAGLPTLTSHVFECQASSPTSSLVITVTDEFGKVYTETMTRPKELTTDMK